MRLALFALCLCFAGCDTSFSPHESNKATIEGCSEALAHLKSCCPKYGSYVSCAIFTTSTNENARPDLSKGQSHCLLAKDCDRIERSVLAGGSLCDFQFQSKDCK